jgi:CubicO group peptidase (beta-lactamase class C family)
MRILSVTGILLAFTLMAGAQPVLPDTPAGRQFRGWLQAFNSGNPEEVRKFAEVNRPSSVKNLGGLLQFRDQTGGFDLRKVEESSATRVTGLVQEKHSDQFARFVVEVGKDAPYIIEKLDLQAIPRPAEFPLSKLSDSELAAALDASLKKDTAADRFSGTVLIAKSGKTVFSGAYGLADREKKIPNQLDTRFRIGSMNKMFTAVAVMQLVQEGKIGLQGKVGDYIRDYPNQDVAKKVTIHELLTHTGATGDFFGPEFDKHRLELKTIDDYIKLYGARPPAYEPGDHFEYSNYGFLGFLLLGDIVEHVTGVSYYDYVRDHIYKIAGMASTASLSENEAVAGRSVGYMKPDAGALRPNTDTLPYRGTSAGGGYSTVGDLVRFAQSLLGHKLLDAHFTELLTTGKVDSRGGKYAYGLFVSGSGKDRWFGHGGGAPGMNGDLKIFPESGYVIAVLANLDPPAAQRVSDFAANRLP